MRNLIQMKRSFFVKIKNASVKTYLLYAIGEMLLIVVSLFLALQLNNLNEKRKSHKRLDTFKALLTQDLQEDLSNLTNAKATFELEMNEIDDYSERLNAPGATIDTLIKIAKTEFNPNIPPFVQFNRTNWETLKATGDVGLIDQAVIRGMNDLLYLQREQRYYEEFRFFPMSVYWSVITKVILSAGDSSSKGRYMKRLGSL